MSLKAFHIFFIGVSTLCAFGFGYWLLQSGNSIANVLGALLSFLTGIALILYGNRFLKKLKHVSFI